MDVICLCNYDNVTIVAILMPPLIIMLNVCQQVHLSVIVLGFMEFF